MISTVVVLPAPFGPRSATSSPRRDGQRQAVEARSARRTASRAPRRRSPPRHRPTRVGTGAHGAILAYCRSKSASVSSPTWMERMTPPGSTKYVCGRPIDPVGGLGGLVRVDDRGPGRRRTRPRNPCAGAGGIVGQDAHDRQPVGRVLGLLGLQQRELLAARHARWTPEVEDDRLAAAGRTGGTAARPGSSRRCPGRDRRSSHERGRRRSGSRSRPTGWRPRSPRRRWRGRPGSGDVAWWACLLERRRPRHVGYRMQRTDEGVRPGRESGDVIHHGRRADDRGVCRPPWHQTHRSGPRRVRCRRPGCRTRS